MSDKTQNYSRNLSHCNFFLLLSIFILITESFLKRCSKYLFDIPQLITMVKQSNYYRYGQTLITKTKSLLLIRMYTSKFSIKKDNFTTMLIDNLIRIEYLVITKVVTLIIVY